MTATITPLEALRRLIAEVKQLDEVEVGARWNQLQGELGVAEGVVRDVVEQKPIGWLTGDSTSHREGTLSDLSSTYEFAKSTCDETNRWERAQPDCDSDYVDRVPEPVFASPVAAQPSKTQAVPEDVLTAAIKWWEALRPVAWSEAEHLAQPAVNASTGRGAKLALAIAAHVAATATAVSAATRCAGCEGSPAVGNNPCAVCGSSVAAVGAAPSGDVGIDKAILRLREAHDEYLVRSHLTRVSQELSAAKLALYAAITATKE